jgi:DNA-binding HxlR family transcriptional regulator
MSGLRLQTIEECLAVQRVLRRTADKWSCLLIANLVDGTMHFNELRRSIKGISQWSLTRTVRGLERDGMISRMVSETRPQQVDYALTDLGRSLLDQLRALGAWALERELAIRQAQDRFDEGAPHRRRYPRVTSRSA